MTIDDLLDEISEMHVPLDDSYGPWDLVLDLSVDCPYQANVLATVLNAQRICLF